MIEARGSFGFVAEAVEGLAVAGEMGREKFEHDEAAEAQVFGFIDPPHAAFAELGENFVVRQDLAEHAVNLQ